MRVRFCMCNHVIQAFPMIPHYFWIPIFVPLAKASSFVFSFFWINHSLSIALFDLSRGFAYVFLSASASHTRTWHLCLQLLLSAKLQCVPAWGLHPGLFSLL